MKNTPVLKGIVALILCVFSFGCATIMASGPDQFAVQSNPKGAKVFLDGNLVGETPVIIKISRKDEGVIRLEKTGYETYTIDRDKVFNGWFIGDILLLSPLAVVIDLVTSNQGKYSTDNVSTELVKKK